MTLIFTHLKISYITIGLFLTLLIDGLLHFDKYFSCLVFKVWKKYELTNHLRQVGGLISLLQVENQKPREVGTQHLNIQVEVRWGGSWVRSWGAILYTKQEKETKGVFKASARITESQNG